LRSGRRIRPRDERGNSSIGTSNHPEFSEDERDDRWRCSLGCRASGPMRPDSPDYSRSSLRSLPTKTSTTIAELILLHHLFLFFTFHFHFSLCILFHFAWGLSQRGDVTTNTGQSSPHIRNHPHSSFVHIAGVQRIDPEILIRGTHR
jgi:hypothetical protein